jgi:uncharacterized protein YndB with AHSA1/START domain
MKMTTTSKLTSAQAVADTEMGLALASVDVTSPPEFVFRALSEKDEIESWWGSDDTYHMQDYQADFRVGGHYSITGAGVDGSRFPGHGEFLEIDAPRKMSYTRAYDWDFPVLGRRPTTIAYLLEPTPTGTRVTVRHEGFVGAPDAALIHADGWKHVLNWLQGRSEKRETSAVKGTAQAAAESVKTAEGTPSWWKR